MKAKFLPALAAVLALAACAAPEGRSEHGHGHHHGHRHGQDRHHEHRGEKHERRGEKDAGSRFGCRNGLSVQVNSMGSDRIKLDLDGQAVVLSADVSASGERYVSANGLYGKATEWHQKGGEAVFEFTDPYGNKVETVCQAR
ncbi:Membrane-bound lysozyme-inhibitor of c-type lysozyme [Kingella potus]|uniref:Membrane-bound lysozyme-inhibitor of c-type lysozyme n=1 Tax=Kingella potus TaxID=265175 RepID=A0A377R1F3_9NEIS|nr:MliC family protein [Kingella potus]UOP00243.1 MliC family protein [Kingella potus]STR02700.1 Membrane-bound lysozyme-inhibitor of c-type lysozyme [Kingella potus]